MTGSTLESSHFSSRGLQNAIEPEEIDLLYELKGRMPKTSEIESRL